ncbi:family 78 glycoside hydrolase catalytic domain [Paenibacillus oryzisoli]|uniref:family 78 glycoside hydrolase catalytic domain n=1 Tax=Paenibacillus oryzisoli TaxID=1850517 RepID=UPI001EFAD89C|nr:family 78 glycoside hydrolase catalytic domain [Paenibacillus oryzisoli]
MMDIANCLTPYKWKKPVLVGSGAKGAFDCHAVDCPFVFRHNDCFYMMYVGFDGTGYQTALATSVDLLNWQHLSTILTRDQEGNAWDSRNIAGTWMLRDNDIHGPGYLKKWNGKYWLAYHSYPGDGYEAGSAKIGLAWTEDGSLMNWNRLENPILVPEEGGEWEKGGLYKECLLEHEGTFYLFYNAKDKDDGVWIEQTGLATSKDLVQWTRHSHNPVLQVTPNAWDSGFVSDPCVLLDGSRWAMFYFGFNYKAAQEGIALSDNLLDWRKYEEPIIRIGDGHAIDSVFAHKPSVISHNGILYHFYTACRRPMEGDATCNIFPEFRTIAVATSLPLAIGSLRTEGRPNPIGLDETNPRLGWSFLDQLPLAFRQKAYRIQVATSYVGLMNGDADSWDSGVVNSGDHTAIPYKGTPLQPRQRYYWKLNIVDEAGTQYDSVVAWWEMGQLDSRNWQGKWIANPDLTEETKGASLFRRHFNVEHKVARARVYISGLGHYELLLNGRKIGDHELDPGWTNYDRTVLYTTYDITSQLKSDENIVQIELGNGFYHVPGGKYAKFKDSFGTPTCLADIVIEYTTGACEWIRTDSSWQASHSPLLFTCMYGGEEYDATREDGNAASWYPAVEIEGPSGKLIAQSAPPVKVMRTFEPKSISNPKPGVYVVDLGQNFSGWPRIRVSGAAGSKVVLTCAEMLTEEGLINQKWTGSPSEFIYILSGNGMEEWRPKFSYTGFRYVMIEGAIPEAFSSQGESSLPVLYGIEGEMLYPELETAGGFECSDPLLNRIHEMITMAILSNTKSVFTDCPHREKLGWLEQVHLMGPSIMFNYDVEAMLKKVLQDISDAQLPDGMVPTIAPEYVEFGDTLKIFRDATAWGGTYILTPWEVLQRYGNINLIQKHYQGMKRYLAYLTEKSEGYIITEGLGDWYDIGPAGPGHSQNTPIPFTETAIYYGMSVVMQKIAALLHEQADVQQYEQLTASIQTAFQEKYWDEQAISYATGSDTALSMPIAIGLAPEQHQADLIEKLVRQITERGYQTTAGDVGYRYLLLALSRAGRSDVIHRMSQVTEKPSYGYQIAHGATTLTEAWDGPTVGKSQNHFMLGHLEEWLFTGLAGIDFRYDTETDRYNIMIKPYMPGDMKWAEAWQKLRPGYARVRWERDEKDELSISVTIPPNAKGIVYVTKAICGQDEQAVLPRGVKKLRDELNDAVFEIGSGSFIFYKQNVSIVE